jgi:hypothetical protein
MTVSGWLAAASICAATTPPDERQYPALDPLQLGHIAFIVKIAHLPGGDWSQMGQDDPGQGGFDSYRYQLAMMSYTLALANYHYTPAYRELYQDASERLIEKMLREDVWGFWELTSRGAKLFNPDLRKLGTGWIDPVKHQNIMYSGHLFQMINTYQMLYNSSKYDVKASLRFIYDPVGRGMGRQEFDYDNRSLADTLYKGFRENEWRGIECEPNAIFPECNQHPILGYMLYDARHRTDFFRTVSTRYKRQFDALKYLDPKTGSFMDFYLVQQKKVLHTGLPWSDGWVGSFMHAWDKTGVERIYPIQREKYLVALPDGTATIAMENPTWSYSHDHGFFAVLAAEVGDIETRNKLLAYADEYWNPTWEGNTLHYPRHDSYVLDGENPDTNPTNIWRRVQVLTGNALLGLARINLKDGLYTLYSQPWGDEHFREPYIGGVNYPSTLVTRAVYDRARKALILTLKPGSAADLGKSAPWQVHNLNAKARYGLWQNGRKVAELALGKADVAPDSAQGLSISPTSDGIEIQSQLQGDTTFVIAEET